MQGVPVLGGKPVQLPARRGAILPLEWQAHPGIHIHYCTGEISEVIVTPEQVTIQAGPDDFVAAVSLNGYHCDEMYVEQQSDENRFILRGARGEITFKINK